MAEVTREIADAVEERVCNANKVTSEALNERMEGYEDKMDTRMGEFKKHVRDNVDGVRNHLSEELRHMRVFFMKIIIWLSVPMGTAMAGLYFWEWEQVEQARLDSTSTATVIATIVEQQESLQDRLLDMKEANQRTMRQQDEINRLRIAALRSAIESGNYRAEVERSEE